MLLFSHTGKSSAIQYAVQDPLANLDLTDTIINKTTSSGQGNSLQTRRKELFSLLRSSTSSTSYLSLMKTTLPVMSRYSANSSQANAAPTTSPQIACTQAVGWSKKPEFMRLPSWICAPRSGLG